MGDKSLPYLHRERRGRRPDSIPTALTLLIEGGKYIVSYLNKILRLEIKRKLPDSKTYFNWLSSFLLEN